MCVVVRHESAVLPLSLNGIFLYDERINDMKQEIKRTVPFNNRHLAHFAIGSGMLK
jgi:hypothetical protein